MKLILLNGPPRSGKDTAAAILLDYFHNRGLLTMHDKLSAPLKSAFAAITSTPLRNFVNQDWEHRKEEIVPSLGVSYRQWQIDFSEKFMKPLYNRDIFARLLHDRLALDQYDLADVAVISDCGFQLEVDYLAKRYSCFIIRLHRNDCSFANDSREFVYAKGPHCFDHEISIQNDGSLELLKHTLISAATRILETS